MELNKRILITIVACCFFMEGLDGTIINTALPQIAQSLQTDPLHLKVALTAYLLAAGIIIPVSGWMADRFGCRRVLSTALLIFLIGSISCGFSHNLTELVLSRVIQGVGGALSLPVGRLLFVRNFSKAEIVAAMSTTATFGLLGPSLGPLIGGALTTYFNWRAIFFVNIPIGLVGLYFTFKYITNLKHPAIKRFDLNGFLILSCSLAALLIGFDTIADPILSVYWTILLLLTGVTGLISYAFYAKKYDHALISAKLFQDKTFSCVIIGSIFIRMSISAPPFLIPLLLQVGFGYSPMVSGICTAAVAFGMLITKFFMQNLLKTFGHRQVLIVNSCFYACGVAALSIITFHPPLSIILLLLLLNGIFVSIQFTTMNTLSYGSIPSSVQASGSSFISSFQQILGSFGIALAALTLQLFLHSRHILHTYSPPAFRYTLLVLALYPLISSLIFRKLSKSLKFN